MIPALFLDRRGYLKIVDVPSPPPPAVFFPVDTLIMHWYGHYADLFDNEVSTHAPYLPTRRYIKRATDGTEHYPYVFAYYEEI